ncbi:sigma-E processing peptidase SpoIIGA [Sporosarcina sp. 179-K 3D1 HS]|uniref:sigma-E processing peptidase SpoIIGA n=1 Tax=Sporosarcina sp. 179-K 3D1 HS TaxID=3232169 RepID=UPI0039A07F6C
MYGEVIVGINMLFNYIILSFANKAGPHIQASRRRLILASFAGAFPVVVFPSSVLVIILSFFSMIICAFGAAAEKWKKSAVVALIGGLFAGGALTAIPIRLGTMNETMLVLIYASAAYVSLAYMKKKWLDVRTASQLSTMRASSTLRIWDAEMEVEVFVDSGNACMEPLSGTAVHFVSFQAVEAHVPEPLRKPLLEWDPSQTKSLAAFPDPYRRTVRLIRLMTVQGQSWALGFKYDQWMLDSGEVLQPGYIVLTQNDRRYPEGAEAILHRSAMESINRERRTSHAV